MADYADVALVLLVCQLPYEAGRVLDGAEDRKS